MTQITPFEMKVIYYIQLVDEIIVFSLPWLKALGIMTVALFVGWITYKLIRYAGRS